jgi:hypothetical protein
MMKNKKSLSYFNRRIILRISKFYRGLTSQDRVLPDYIIIGVQKGGTSSLFRYLTRHPKVLPGYKKEVKFFDGRYAKGIDWYRYNFPLVSQMSDPHAQTGEASPSYVFHPLVPQRIKESLPNIKLILLLRDPVARAYSHYQGNLRKGHEKLSFREAIEQEENRLEGEREKIIADQTYPMYRYLVFSYLSRGVYIDQLRNWFKSFPREQILILRSEDFFNNPPKVFQRVLTFLGLPDWELDNYDIFNFGSYEKMDHRMENELKTYFHHHNQELYEYLGLNFNWENQ